MDPRSTHSYSMDHLVSTVFEKELINYLRCGKIIEGDEVQTIVIAYMERRIKELKERWK